jgi:hypothetical protein
LAGGKRIVVRHVNDLFFCAAALGDILVRSHPAAARHRTIRNRDGPAVRQFHQPALALAILNGGQHIVEIFLGI